EVDRHPALDFLLEAVGIDAGQRLHERRLAVVDVSGGADDDGLDLHGFGPRSLAGSGGFPARGTGCDLGGGAGAARRRRRAEHRPVRAARGYDRRVTLPFQTLQPWLLERYGRPVHRVALDA